jgi:hypothetical protein
MYNFFKFRYKNFRAKDYASHRTLLAFEGDTCVYGLNFSNPNEAQDFKYHLDKRYEQEQRSGSEFFLYARNEMQVKKVCKNFLLQTIICYTIIVSFKWSSVRMEKSCHILYRVSQKSEIFVNFGPETSFLK